MSNNPYELRTHCVLASCELIVYFGITVCIISADLKDSRTANNPYLGMRENFVFVNLLRSFVSGNLELEVEQKPLTR